jgi:hypothetical protein
VKRIIGRGNFADVKLAREKSSGNVYALKAGLAIKNPPKKTT